MLVLLQSGGLKGGGINFDAKLRRNSTDLEDLFFAHIGGIDVFARSLLIANDILENSEFLNLRKMRYNSFDSGNGKEFEEGKFKLEDLFQHALQNQNIQPISGKQELLENLINKFI